MPENMKVLVTGGAGFIGSHLVDRLITEGYSVRVIDNLSTGKMENIQHHIDSGKVDFVKGDIQNAALVKTCVHNVDAVIHLAAITSVPFSVENPDLTYENNVAGTVNLLIASAKEKVLKFVFISSCAVYGEPCYLPIDENHSRNPISPYAGSKLAAEQFCLGFHKKQLLKATVLRLFNVYGPRQGVNDYSGVITHFINRSRQQLSLIIHGDGSQTRDFVYVLDVAEAIMSSLKTQATDGEVFNIGFGKPTSVYELAQTVLALVGLDAAISYEKPRLGDIKDSYANISKAEKLLGYTPAVSLVNGLRALLEEKVVIK